MAVIQGRTWLEVLSADECWRLVATQDVGRVAVEVDGLAEIFPVNFVVDGRAIVFRTDTGSKLEGLRHLDQVCFEVDAIDGRARSGWSVMVKGRPSELVRGDELARASALPLDYWAYGEKSHWLRVEPTSVTGRRLHRPSGASEREDAP
jgi:nitroimidazol reductase NimA-like FMN-containing flavoprotein (pyridoxamine 5'-phosphate oxidase superfamily)